MARQISEIQNEMLLAIANDSVLSLVFTSTSATAMFRLFTYIVAVSIGTMENLFDTHDAEVATTLFNQKSGRLPWYRTMALAFLYGFDLVTDHDYFDTTGATDEQIEAAKVVKYCAVNEAEDSSTVIIKIAGEENGVLAPIPLEQKEAFEAYMEEVKWAGVDLEIINFLPDRLYLSIQVKRDALVLDANGISILNGNNPVNEAIQAYMKELPFNGELRLNHLIDRLQVVPGVIDATILNAETSWIDAETAGYGDLQPLNIATIPESGYFEVVTFDNITYVV
ncbi:nucleotidyltransferase [Flavobacterium alkalisoli]|uniref:Nucleotidyltransferase n=1 Tax=Flavobacterium alkalisoli TaxID=2602769 RepID=A0A5B9FXK7_9FLAO|nr:nucleotidyltransferase [Flavobacterium alkalisoli]QEE51031.1 nucleotidyltransferase [Flavobacterium alkalisoli]